MARPTIETRRATTGDALVLAALLHDFNTEFDTETPGVAVLARRLETLLTRDDLFAVLAGEPAVGFGLVTLRPNVWFDGPVALLDELYVVPAVRSQGIGSVLLDAIEQLCRGEGVEAVEINVDEPNHDARRFYERHGYRNTEPDDEAVALYYWRPL